MQWKVWEIDLVWDVGSGSVAVWEPKAVYFFVVMSGSREASAAPAEATGLFWSLTLLLEEDEGDGERILRIPVRRRLYAYRSNPERFLYTVLGLYVKSFSHHYR